jgi:disulfide bond formation protein DsbB
MKIGAAGSCLRRLQAACAPAGHALVPTLAQPLRQRCGSANCCGAASADGENGMSNRAIEWLRRERAAAAALAIFLIAGATLAGAWFFQIVLEMPPCHLCLEERIPYHVVIPLSLVVAIAALVRAPRRLLDFGFLVILVAVLSGAALSAYHAGVEWHWWPGPSDCTGPVTDFTKGGSLLNQLQSVHIVPCDVAAWRLFGISLAGYNFLISLALAAIAAFGLLARKRVP